jgi:hypothetical protein
MQNKYSCGNDPQPGDVVEVVNAKEIKGEDFLFIMAAGIKLGNTHTVNDISVNGQIRVGKVYHIHPSRFRLIRRAGEQPQPGDEEVRTPIQDALYATSKFTTDDCTLLADGILMYLKDAGMGIVRQPQPDMAKLLEEKEREIERLKEQVNDLKMDAAAHEYNEAERIKFQPEYEREICVRFAEYIGGLEMKMYKDGWCEPGGSNGFYYSTNDLYTKFLGEHTANH